MKRQSHWISGSVCALSAAVLTAGCGGGGGGGSSTNNTPPANLPAAVASLNSLVRSSSGDTSQLTIGSVTPVVNQFSAALQASPDNKDALTGYAISEAALASLQFAQLFGVNSAQAQAHVLTAQSTRTDRLTQLAQSLTLWKLPARLSSSSAGAWPKAGDFLPALSARSLVGAKAHDGSTVSPASVQAGLAQLDTALATVESALGQADSDPNYNYVLADYSQPGNTAATVKVGSAELHILTAVVNALRAVANTGVAYNADPGAFNFGGPLPDLSTQSSLSPEQYLPGGSFATLSPTGKANLSTAKNEINSLADNGVSAIESVKTRDNSGYLLNPGTLVTMDQLNTAEDQIKFYQNFLSSIQNVDVTVGGTHTTTRLNVSAFFDNPPADLKAFLPTLPVQNNDGQTVVVLQGFPDPTFGGIFPDGLSINQGQAQLPVYASSSGSTGTSFNDVISFILSL